MSALPMRRPVDLLLAEQMLEHIAAADDRDVWLQVGMGLHAEFGPEAFDVWDRWSAQAGNYDARACKASWRGFRAKPGGYGIGTVIKLATDGGWRWPADGQPVDRAALRQAQARRRAEWAARAQQDAATRAQAAQNAHRTAHELWAAASRTGVSPYAARKGIDAPESVRFEVDGTLLVPMLRYDLPREQALRGVQRILPGGRKLYTHGVAKAGTACRLGLAVVGEPVFICEGWATGMSLRMAMAHGWGARRWPVFVSFDAGNLPLVADLVHQVHPASPLVIVADDDHATRVQGLPRNTGRIQAQIAQESVMDAGCALCVRMHPVFAAATARGGKDSDFNDLHQLEGIGAVAHQLRVAIDCLEELKNHA